MNARDRIIAGMSDVELLMFHQVGGSVPERMWKRLHPLIASVSAEHDVERPAAKPTKGPPIKFPEHRAGAGCERFRRDKRRKAEATKRKTRIAA